MQSWNTQTKRYEQETGRDGLKLVPVSANLQNSWRDSYRKDRYEEIEWKWRKQDSMPLHEHQDAGSVYALVRATIELGEQMFPRAATVQSMKSINSFMRPWYETAGFRQTNKILRGGQEVEYEVFLPCPTGETGCTEKYPEDLKRPMHWRDFKSSVPARGFLITRLWRLHEDSIVVVDEIFQ